MFSGPTYPEELRQAWSKVIAYAWKNPDFMNSLRKDPARTINAVVNDGQPEQLAKDAGTIIDYINQSDSIEGFFSLPPLPEQLQNLSEDQLAAFVNQPGVFGIMRST